MPTSSLVFLRTSLLMLVAGITVGAIGVIDPGWLTAPRQGAHAHLLLVGWLINTVVGVAWWMFPRVPGTVARARVVLAGWAALNGGLLLRVGADLFGDGIVAAQAPLRWTSAVLQVAGIVLIAALLWRRVRGPSNRSRRSAVS